MARLLVAISQLPAHSPPSEAAVAAAADSSRVRVLQEVYEDAVAEGIRWVELTSGSMVEDGEVSEEEADKWRVLIEAWREVS